jgi:hypothetical protein
LPQIAVILDFNTIMDYISFIGIADERLTHVLLAIAAAAFSF